MTDLELIGMNSETAMARIRAAETNLKTVKKLFPKDKRTIALFREALKTAKTDAKKAREIQKSIKHYDENGIKIPFKW